MDSGVRHESGFQAAPMGQGVNPVGGPTDVNGNVGFGMGRGAYYWPDQGQTGPHAVWVYGATTRSDLVQGLGMVGGTNHDHFDVEFVKLDEDSGPVDPPNGDECPVEEILAELDRIEESVRNIRKMLK